MPNMAHMDTLNITQIIDAIVKETGFAPSTICGRACNDPLLYERLERRKQKDAARLTKLRRYKEGLPKKEVVK